MFYCIGWWIMSRKKSISVFHRYIFYRLLNQWLLRTENVLEHRTPGFALPWNSSYITVVIPWKHFLLWRPHLKPSLYLFQYVLWIFLKGLAGWLSTVHHFLWYNYPLCLFQSWLAIIKNDTIVDEVQPLASVMTVLLVKNGVSSW